MVEEVKVSPEEQVVDLELHRQDGLVEDQVRHHPIQDLLLEQMVLKTPEVAVEEVEVQLPRPMVEQVDLVLFSSHIPLDKYPKDCYNPKYLKQIQLR